MLTPEDEFIFARDDVYIESGYDYDDIDAFRCLRHTTKDEFSLRAKSLALYLFLCETGTHGAYNVHLSLLIYRGNVEEKRLEKIHRSAIDHGAASVWSHPIYEFGEEFVTEKYYFGSNYDGRKSLDIKKKKVSHV